MSIRPEGQGGAKLTQNFWATFAYIEQDGLPLYRLEEAPGPIATSRYRVSRYREPGLDSDNTLGETIRLSVPFRFSAPSSMGPGAYELIWPADPLGKGFDHDGVARFTVSRTCSLPNQSTSEPGSTTSFQS